MKMLLLTAQRKGEVAGMCRSEINMEKRHWVIPSERCKNGKAHIVHLSPQAVELIQSLPDTGGDFLFTLNGTSLINGFATMKPRLDKLIAAQSGDLQPWTFHDLRRTAASGMAQLGIAPHVLDRVLNHTSGTISGVAAIYNRFQYLDERQHALDLWAQHVEAVVKSKVKRVVL